MASKDKNPKASATPKKITTAKAAPKKTKATTSKSTVKSKATSTNSKTTTNQAASNIATLNLSNKHLISKTNGADMVANFLNIASKNTLPFNINKCYDFNKEIFDIIFSDAESIGIRIYFGVNSQNEMCIVFNGIDSKLNDIYIPLDSALQTALKDTHGVADLGEVCAPGYFQGKGPTQLP
jgi:hypothetical protein